MAVRKQPQISVADYVTQQIMLSGKSQKEIAEEIGYQKPNIITMFKKGDTKVPINKVSELATALGVDPVHFLRVVLTEYSPSTWEVLEKIMGTTMVSENELSVLSVIRKVSGGIDIAPETDEEKMELAKLAEKWKKREATKVDAASRRKVIN